MKGEHGWVVEHHYTTSQQWAMEDARLRQEVANAAKKRIRQYKNDHNMSDEWEKDILEMLFAKPKNKLKKGI